MISAGAPCLLCGGTARADALTAFDRRHASAEEYRYVRCAGCGLVVRDPLPAAADLSALYPSEAIAPREKRFDRPVNRWAVRNLYGVESARRPRMLRPVVRLLARWIMADLLEPYGSNRLLDVGCGLGALLRAQRHLGWSVRGIEPDARAVARCREDGLEVHHGTVGDAPFGADHDVVLLSHVIEHVPDPVEMLRGAARFLAPGGRLRVITPNARAVGLRLYRSCWFSLDAPRHLCLFDTRTIRLLGARAELRIRRVTTPGQPQTLAYSRCYARIQGQSLPPDLDRRRALVAAAAQHLAHTRRARDLFAPLAAAGSVLGRGEVLEAELVRP